MNLSKKQGLILHKFMRWCACILLSGFLTGCSGLVDSTSNKEKVLSLEGFSIKTDRDVYLVEESNNPVEISYAYVNEGKQAFYPGSCLGVPSDNLEKLIDGEWVPAYTPFCARPLGPPIKTKPGDIYNATIQLHPSTWDPTRKNASWHGGDIEGTYRVWERVYSEWDKKKFDNYTLQSEIIVSNAFEIRRAS